MSLLQLSPALWITILATVISGIIFVFVFLKYSIYSKNKDAILFIGPCGAGKTALSYKVCYDCFPDTTTSIKAGKYILSRGNSKSVPVIDFPGHPKLRSQVNEYLSRARRIVFVVDASKIQTQAREAAEFLYDLFTNPLLENGPPMLIACNKSDIPGSRPPPRVKLAIQQELDKIKKTRQSMEIVGDNESVSLGREGQPFSIERDPPIKVSFASISGKSAALDELYAFLE